MELSQRPGFVASPKTIIPVVIVVVLLILVSSLGSGDVSTARLAATAIVGALLVALFAILAILSRARARRESQV